MQVCSCLWSDSELGIKKVSLFWILEPERCTVLFYLIISIVWKCLWPVEICDGVLLFMLVNMNGHIKTRVHNMYVEDSCWDTCTLHYIWSVICLGVHGFFSPLHIVNSSSFFPPPCFVKVSVLCGKKSIICLIFLVLFKLWSIWIIAFYNRITWED